MELAYHELNRREYELTRHVSLRQLDPKALLALRATGQCTVTLPEELFDSAASSAITMRMEVPRAGRSVRRPGWTR
jgi:Tc toxin complex TcA C-terminal TcB-binding domain